MGLKGFKTAVICERGIITNHKILSEFNLLIVCHLHIQFVSQVFLLQ